MEAFVTAGAGFLLAVLWFDLMHDVLVRGHDPDADLPEPALAGIATYYARVTTGARPMNRLVLVVMLATVGATVAELVSGFEPTWIAGVSLPPLLAAIVLAGRKTVPNARRLGTRVDDAGEQSRLARSIYGDHLFCFSQIALVLVFQLAAAAT